mmetsp:Transcript_27827/g.75710  ORF Transcript_27827/g.75710 Transcript_27827/m.75710 type:complete len:139 (-) Transcript_27827:266-682(-)
MDGECFERRLPSTSPSVNGGTGLGCFRGHLSAFNQPIKDWEVSQVFDMDEIFHCASAFKKPLDEWDVSDVRNMKEMSIEASAKLLKCITVIVQPPSISPSLNGTFLNQFTEISGTLLCEDAFHQPPKHHVWDGSRDVV